MTSKKPNSRPRVLFLNRSYWPDTEATGQLLTELCESLSDTFEVHVLAGEPNASLESDWRNVTEKGRVAIHRIRHLSFPKRFTALKALNFVSFTIAARWRINRLRPIPDIVVFETDPFLLPFVARALSKRHGTKMIGYLQDIYPDVAVALGKARETWWIRRLRSALFRIYRKADATVVLSRDMRQLVAESNIDEHKVHVVSNWSDEQQIRPIESAKSQFRQTVAEDDEFVVMYSGNLGLTQNLDRLLEAARALDGDRRVRFALVGRGAKKDQLQNWVKQHNVGNVDFYDYQPKDRLFDSLGAADLHFVPLDERLYRYLMPSKIYGILAAGRPILTTAPAHSELASIVEENRIGFAVPGGSSAELAARISDVARMPKSELTEMGRRARQLAESKYNRDRSIQQFSSILHTVSAEASVD